MVKEIKKKCIKKNVSIKRIDKRFRRDSKKEC